MTPQASYDPLLKEIDQAASLLMGPNDFPSCDRIRTHGPQVVTNLLAALGWDSAKEEQVQTGYVLPKKYGKTEADYILPPLDPPNQYKVDYVLCYPPHIPYAFVGFHEHIGYTPSRDYRETILIAIPFATGILFSQPGAYNPYIALWEWNFDVILF